MYDIVYFANVGEGDLIIVQWCNPRNTAHPEILIPPGKKEKDVAVESVWTGKTKSPSWYFIGRPTTTHNLTCHKLILIKEF